MLSIRENEERACLENPATDEPWRGWFPCLNSCVCSKEKGSCDCALAPPGACESSCCGRQRDWLLESLQPRSGLRQVEEVGLETTSLKILGYREGQILHHKAWEAFLCVVLGVFSHLSNGNSTSTCLTGWFKCAGPHIQQCT